MRSMMNASAPTCTAKMYPSELLQVLEQARLSPEQKEEYMNTYNAYRIAFNKKFGHVLTNEDSKRNMEGGRRHRQTRRRMSKGRKGTRKH